MPDPRLEKTWLLIQQARYSLAEQELRQFLAQDPNEATAHAYLSLCFTGQDQHEAAIQAAERAIVLTPDWSYPHYCLARSLYYGEHLQPAKAAISEALRLDPEQASYYSLQASIYFDCRCYDQTLRSAEAGLRCDPHHISCANMRALALLFLNQIQPAQNAIAATLAQDPENAMTHAIQGWVALHQGQHKTALHSFQEALRLNPNQEWARRGLVEALKARNAIYRVIMRYDLWRDRTKVHWGHVAALLFLPQLRAFFVLLVIVAWAIRRLALLSLRFDPFGRLILSDTELKATQWTAAIVIALAIGGCLSLLTQNLAWVVLFPGIAIVANWLQEERTRPKAWTEWVETGCFVVSAIGLLGLFATLLLPQSLQEPAAVLACVLVVAGLLLYILWLITQFIYGTIRNWFNR
jgi:Tfp pilus assembly protein PilF